MQDRNAFKLCGIAIIITMADKKETQLSFLFEIPNLANGERIKNIRIDMRQYAISRGFNLPPK